MLLSQSPSASEILTSQNFRNGGFARMAKQYYIKKNPMVTGPDIEWIAINGEEFYQLITSPAGKGRHFIDMEDFMIEATKEEYTDWRKEKDHHDYLNEQESTVQVLSFYSDMPTKNGNGEEIIPDRAIGTEDLAIKSIVQKAVTAALDTLDEDSYQLIDSLILSDCRKSERDLASETGLSQKAVNKRKNKILKNLKILVLKSEKSSQ